MTKLLDSMTNASSYNNTLSSLTVTVVNTVVFECDSRHVLFILYDNKLLIIRLYCTTN